MPLSRADPLLQKAVQDFVERNGGPSHVATSIGMSRTTLWRFVREGKAIPRNVELLRGLVERTGPGPTAEGGINGREAERFDEKNETITERDVVAFFKVLHHLEEQARQAIGLGQSAGRAGARDNAEARADE